MWHYFAPERVITLKIWNFYDSIVKMIWIQIFLVTFACKKFIFSTLSRWIKFCPLWWKKRYSSTLPHAGRAFGFIIFMKVMNLMWHLSSIPEPYKFEFLLIEWRISCPYTWKTWSYYVHYNGTFGGIGDLYLSVVMGGGHDNRFMWKMTSATRWTPKIFSPHS